MAAAMVAATEFLGKIIEGFRWEKDLQGTHYTLEMPLGGVKRDLTHDIQYKVDNVLNGLSQIFTGEYRLDLGNDQRVYLQQGSHSADVSDISITVKEDPRITTVQAAMKFLSSVHCLRKDLAANPPKGDGDTESEDGSASSASAASRTPSPIVVQDEGLAEELVQVRAELARVQGKLAQVQEVLRQQQQENDVLRMDSSGASKEGDQGQVAELAEAVKQLEREVKRLNERNVELEEDLKQARQTKRPELQEDFLQKQLEEALQQIQKENGRLVEELRKQSEESQRAQEENRKALAEREKRLAQQEQKNAALQRQLDHSAVQHRARVQELQDTVAGKDQQIQDLQKKIENESARHRRELQQAQQKHREDQEVLEADFGDKARDLIYWRGLAHKLQAQLVSKQ